jgi:hypothetical protein
VISDADGRAGFRSCAAVAFTFALPGLIVSSCAEAGAVRGFGAFCAKASGAPYQDTTAATAATGSEAARLRRRVKAARASV